MIVIDKLEAILEVLYFEIKDIQPIKLYSLKEVERMNTEEIETLIGKIDTFKTEQEIRDRMIEKISKNKEKYKEKYDNKMNLVIDVKKESRMYYLEKINKKIEKENEEIKLEKNKLRSTIGKIQDVVNELKKNKIDIDKINKLLQETYLKETVKNDLIKDVNEIAIEKNKKYEEEKKLRNEKRKLEELKRLKEKEEEKKEHIEEEKLFEIKNYEYIKNVINTYETIFPNSLFQMPIEDNFELEDLTQIISLSYNELDDDLFSFAFLSILSKIDNSNKEELSIYVELLEKLCEKYELLNNVIDAVSEVKNLYSLFKIDDEDNKILLWTLNTINEVKANNKYNDLEVQNILNNVYETLHNLKRKKLSEKIYINSNLDIKSFILFDYNIDENNTKKTYILSDLDETNKKTLIDSSLDRSKIKLNGYNDFNDLIDDIIIYGKPKIILEKTDKLEKFIRPVYYTNSAYETIRSKMKNATGMYRIRPRITSYVRFVDEKIMLIPNTKKYDQIIELLESKLNNITIDKTKSFNLYINYVDAFKYDDADAYKKAIKRQKISKLRELLKKEKYTNKDLQELSYIIDNTLETFKTLKEINSEFDFKTINKITSDNNLIKKI